MKYYFIELETEQGASYDEGYIQAKSEADAFHEVNAKCQYWYNKSDSTVTEISKEEYKNKKHKSTWT